MSIMWNPNRVTVSSPACLESGVPEPKSASLENETEEIPWNFLISVLKWPCALSRCGGYWPFQLVNGAEWKFKWKSFQGAKLAFMPTLALVSMIGVGINGTMLFGHLAAQVTETERVGYGVTSLTSQVGVILLMFSTILNRNGIAATWNALNRLCNEIASLTVPNSYFGKITKQKFQKWVFKRNRAARIGTTFVFLEAFINVMLSVNEVLPGMFEINGYNQTTITAAILVTCWTIIFRLYMTFLTILLATLLVVAGLYQHLAFQVILIGGESLERCFDQVAIIKSPQKSSENDTLSMSIGDLIKIADGLGKVMDKLNHKLKTQMLVILTILGMGLIFNAFTIVVNFDKVPVFSGGREKQMAELFCFIIDAIMFGVICSSASAVTHNAQSFGDELGKIVSTPSLSPGLISQIQHAACKFSLKPPVFAPGYYFVVNNQLLTSLVAMVTTYLTVLLQLSSHQR